MCFQTPCLRTQCLNNEGKYGSGACTPQETFPGPGGFIRSFPMCHLPIQRWGLRFKTSHTRSPSQDSEGAYGPSPVLHPYIKKWLISPHSSPLLETIDHASVCSRVNNSNVSMLTVKIIPQRIGVWILILSHLSPNSVRCVSCWCFVNWPSIHNKQFISFGYQWY